MREAKRSRTAETALDEVSDHMGEVLRRADDLLAEWSRFGEIVHVQVEREANAIGDAVASAVEGATMRGVAASVDRVLAEQIGQRIASLTAEIGRLEARSRAVTRTLADERTQDRRILWIVAGGVVIANVLLALMLLRPPAPSAIAPAPTTPASGSAHDAVEPAPATGSGSSASNEVMPTTGSGGAGSASDKAVEPVADKSGKTPAETTPSGADKAASKPSDAAKGADATKAAADAKGAHPAKQLAVPPVAPAAQPKHGGAGPKTYGAPVRRN